MISIIIPYRNRESHLKVLLPRLHEIFDTKEYEIIISEQNDTNNFQIACVENIGYQHARGNIIILHQVDYIPSDDVSYEPREDQPVLPGRRGIFLTDDMQLRSLADIPAGYRGFSDEIDPAFYGGVIVMTREHFEKINGLNPLYRGWGNEDEDLRERLKYYKIPGIRNEVGTYWVLNHKDNCPTPEDPRWSDFMEGRQMLNQFHKYLDVGVHQLQADVEVFETEHPRVTWIKSTNYKTVKS